MYPGGIVCSGGGGINPYMAGRSLFEDGSGVFDVVSAFERVLEPESDLLGVSFRRRSRALKSATRLKSKKRWSAVPHGLSASLNAARGGHAPNSA